VTVAACDCSYVAGPKLNQWILLNNQKYWDKENKQIFTCPIETRRLWKRSQLMWGFEIHNSVLCCNYEGRQHFEVATIHYILSLSSFLNHHYLSSSDITHLIFIQMKMTNNILI
jgi:hypothetical protein